MVVEIEQVFFARPDWEAIKPIAGRGEEVRDRLRALTRIGSITSPRRGAPPVTVIGPDGGPLALAKSGFAHF